MWSNFKLLFLVFAEKDAEARPATEVWAVGLAQLISTFTKSNSAKKFVSFHYTLYSVYLIKWLLARTTTTENK